MSRQVIGKRGKDEWGVLLALFAVGSLALGVWIALALTVFAYLKLDFKTTLCSVIGLLVYLIVVRFLGSVIGMLIGFGFVLVIGFMAIKSFNVFGRRL